MGPNSVASDAVELRRPGSPEKLDVLTDRANLLCLTGLAVCYANSATS